MVTLRVTKSQMAYLIKSRKVYQVELWDPPMREAPEIRLYTARVLETYLPQLKEEWFDDVVVVNGWPEAFL